MKNKTIAANFSTAFKIFSSFFKKDDFFFLHEKEILNFTSVSCTNSCQKSAWLLSALSRDTIVWLTFCFSVQKYVPALILNFQHQINVKILKNLFYNMIENRLIPYWISIITHCITKNEKMNGVKIFFPIFVCIIFCE